LGMENPALFKAVKKRARKTLAMAFLLNTDFHR